MPNITMLDIEELRQTKLKPYIDKCPRAPRAGSRLSRHECGHNIDLWRGDVRGWDACFNKGRIPHPLKEVIRVQLSPVRQAVRIEGMSGLLRAKRQGLSEELLDEGIDKLCRERALHPTRREIALRLQRADVG